MAIELTNQSYLSDGAIFMSRKAKDLPGTMIHISQANLSAPLGWQPLRKGTGQKCMLNRPTLPCPCLPLSSSVVIVDVSRAPDIFSTDGGFTTSPECIRWPGGKNDEYGTE
jgi:hypothetical protein